MLLLMDAHSGFPVHYNNSDEEKKKTWTNHSLLFNASAVCWIMSCHLFRHHPGADSAHAQVRPEQHTLISVFKLNSCKLFQFKHLRARGRELTHTVRRFVRALIRRARKPAPQNARKYEALSDVLCLNGQIHTQILSKCPSW